MSQFATKEIGVNPTVSVRCNSFRATRMQHRCSPAVLRLRAQFAGAYATALALKPDIPAACHHSWGISNSAGCQNFIAQSSPSAPNVSMNDLLSRNDFWAVIITIDVISAECSPAIVRRQESQASRCTIPDRPFLALLHKQKRDRRGFPLHGFLAPSENKGANASSPCLVTDKALTP